MLIILSLLVVAVVVEVVVVAVVPEDIEPTIPLKLLVVQALLLKQSLVLHCQQIIQFKLVLVDLVVPVVTREDIKVDHQYFLPSPVLAVVLVVQHINQLQELQNQEPMKVDQVEVVQVR